MTVKSLKILLAATALGLGALACSGTADARVKGRHYGWHYGWHKGWYRGPVVASDYDVAPRRRARHGDCVLASDDDVVAPRRRARHDDCVVATDYDVAPPRRARYDDCIVASDCDVAPRRACRDDCVVASDYVAPVAYDYGYCEPTYSYYAAPAIYAAPVVYTPSWYGLWGYGYGWPF